MTRAAYEAEYHFILLDQRKPADQLHLVASIFVSCGVFSWYWLLQWPGWALNDSCLLDLTFVKCWVVSIVLVGTNIPGVGKGDHPQLLHRYIQKKKLVQR